ncbi:AraC family transcriptional regulator [Ancylobacter terrae]|uniref:AraC family transcriptional regulator n=1 Tax=Ancylobacter sp. sgz301288 TaxID=3342077 RepID=UPI00385F962E
MTQSLTSDWSVVRLSSIEDLSEAVHGAGLSATQMSAAPVTGSLAFTESRGIRFSTGMIDSRVSLTGPLSEDWITIGLGIDLPPGTRHWLNDVSSGNVGVFMPGDEHDSLYVPGSLYAVFTLSDEVLEPAAQRELVLSSRELGGSGVHGRRLAAPQLNLLKRLFRPLHDPAVDRGPAGLDPAAALIEALIDHIGRPPLAVIGLRTPRGYERIVRRARAFIHDNLGSPMSVELIATAAATSPRTLHRAFRERLDETPYSYVLKLRLHRIRYDVISDLERTTTLATIANHWGISELGRLAGWYRELFGELPSQTRERLGRASRPPQLH